MELKSSERKSRQILVWLGAAEQRLAARANRVLKEAGLPYAQFIVLNHLASCPDYGWTVSGLASALETGQPGVSKILRRLAAKGHVRIEADARDGRIRRHHVTPSGEATHREAYRRIVPQAEAIFSGWQAGDIDSLHGLLLRLKIDLHR